MHRDNNQTISPNQCNKNSVNPNSTKKLKPVPTKKPCQQKQKKPHTYKCNETLPKLKCKEHKGLL